MHNHSVLSLNTVVHFYITKYITQRVLVDAPIQSQKDPAAVDKIMKDLDTNGDGQVDFEEFVSLVVGLSIACEQCYQTHMKKMGKK